MSNNAVYEKLMAAFKCVREKTDFVPKVALVLGSGLGNFADQIDVEVRKHAKVVEILERRTRKLRREYLVRWNGVDGPLSWETRYGIRNKAMVDKFDEQWDYAERSREEKQLDETRQSFTREKCVGRTK